MAFPSIAFSFQHMSTCSCVGIIILHLYALLESELCVCDIAKLMEVTQSATYEHLFMCWYYHTTQPPPLSRGTGNFFRRPCQHGRKTYFRVTERMYSHEKDL